jgi:hypothetical protein
MTARPLAFMVVVLAVGAAPAASGRAWAQGAPAPRTVVVSPEQKVVIVPASGAVVVQPAAPPEPVRLGLAYAHAFSQSGELADGRETANTVGLEFAFRGGRVVRQHFVLAHRWERSGTTSRKGFRLDLVSLGFPITILARRATLQFEPVLRLLRGDLMFESVGGGPSHVVFRFESGLGASLVATFEKFYLTLEPVAVDFRYFRATTDDARGGFGTLWTFGLVVGREL